MGGVGHLLHLFLDGLALGDRALEPAASVEAILSRSDPVGSGRGGLRQPRLDVWRNAARSTMKITDAEAVEIYSDGSGLNRLPPLNALRAFEAAARHLNFRLAAGTRRDARRGCATRPSA